MTRTRVLSALALVLAVVALGTVAGGLADGGTSDPSEGVGIGSGEGSGIGEGENIGLGASDADPPDVPVWLGMGPFMLALWISAAAGIIATILFVWSTTLEEVLKLVTESLTQVLGLGIAIILLYLLFLLLSGLFQGGGGGMMGTGGSVSGSVFGESSATDSPSMTSGIMFLGAVAVLGILFMILLPRRNDDGDSGGGTAVIADDESPAETNGTVRPVVDVEDPEATNEVFRAWATLRDRLGRSDRTESPAELRRRALEAGLDEGAVQELTALFNATRYGERPVTSSEERRAREALAAIDGSGGES